MNLKRMVLFMLLSISSISATSQDYRNDMFNIRRAGHEPRISKRSEATQIEDKLRPFYHGVASGDPLGDRVIIWTRVTPENGATEVSVQYNVATDTGLQSIVASGSVVATSERDFTVKVDVQGLQPGRVYYYGFTSGNRHSLTGRTHTIPTGLQDHLRFAVVSCSNYPAGYFNAYARIADRNDIDAILHLGDYIYEYDADSTSYSGATGIKLGRRHEPDAELVTLTDYRTRYAQYRLDADLRRAHQQHPMIHIWDDHESANDSYTDGAENHQPNEGEWLVRKAISKRVCYEWMPTRENSDSTLYRRFSFGDLCDLIMLDSRLDGRNKQVANVGEWAPQASKDSLNNPLRTMISKKQEDWLTTHLKTSTSTWRILGNQVIFSPIDVTPIDTAYLFTAIGSRFSAFVRPQVPLLQAVFEAAFYGDVWNNYPAQRDRISRFLRDESIGNTIIVTGDFHSSFSFETPLILGDSRQNVAVEFVTPSITSANFDENLNTQPSLAPITPALLKTIDTTLTQLNPHLKWEEITQHGYEIVDLTKTKAQCDWYFVESILSVTDKERWARGFVQMSGPSVLEAATQASSGKLVQDLPAPPDPPGITSDVLEQALSIVKVLGYGPNPSGDALWLTYIVNSSTHVRIEIVDGQGIPVISTTLEEEQGLRSVVLSLKGFAQGRYTLRIVTDLEVVNTGIIIQR